MSIFIRAVIVAVVLGLPVTVSAQSHPCDQPTPTSTITLQSSATYKVQFCAKPSEQVEAFVVYINNVPSDLRPLTLVVPANAAGYAFYEGPQELKFARGTYTVQVSVYNRPSPGAAVQESPPSNPLECNVVDDLPPPTAPRLMGLGRA